MTARTITAALLLQSSFALELAARVLGDAARRLENVRREPIPVTWGAEAWVWQMMTPRDRWRS